MSQFHTLKVVDVKKETIDTVSIGFEIPESLKDAYQFIAGQYLTLSFTINGKEERRAYSLCSSPTENILRVAVKKVKNGLVSTHINENLATGDAVKVMTPEGNFVLEVNPSNEKTYVAFAAGSGVTPMLSMLKIVAEKEPQSTFHLFYGNKDENSVIFKAELDQLQSERINVTYIYSRQDSGSALTNGRINEGKAKTLIVHNQLQGANAVYLCGPEQMIVDGSKGIEDAGIKKSYIHYELFTTPVLMESKSTSEASADDFSGEANIKVIYDDEEYEFTLNTSGNVLLEAAIENGADVPFSCKGAVCCTCKAKVIEGKAVMDSNYALSDEEIEEGLILTCTAHPVTETLTLDFDDIY